MNVTKIELIKGKITNINTLVTMYRLSVFICNLDFCLKRVTFRIPQFQDS
jgi:hypothetical protein